MKILYVARERSDAEAAASDLRAAAQNVTVLWTSGLNHIVEWIDQNHDLAALVVDAQVERTGWRPVVQHVRCLATPPTLVVISPEGAGPDFELLGADEFLTNNQSLGRELAVAVQRAVNRARERQRSRQALHGVEQELAHARAALEEAEGRHRVAMAAAAEELAKQQARYEIGLARAAATWEMVDEQLREAAIEVERSRRGQASAAVKVDQLLRRESALQANNARAAHELRAAAEQFAEQRRDFEAQIAQETEKRHCLEETLARAVSERESAEERLALAIAEALTSHRDAERRLAAADAALQDAGARETRERLAAVRRAAAREAQLEEQLREERATRVSLTRQLTDAERAFDELRRDREVAAAEIERLTAERAEVTRTLAASREDFQQTVDRLSSGHDAALAARDQEIEQLRDQITAANQRTERLFDEAQLAMCRCSRDGALIEANGAWSALVRRKIDDLRGANVAAALFESPNDLSWLIERCLSTSTKESIETTLRRKDGARLFVLLSAHAPASDVIEIVAEDLTRSRVLQDRLAQAARMEAVGRLASEVALTCGKLLNGVRENAQRWLMDGAGTAASRQHGQLLLDELTRAHDYLQQLVAYGDKQSRSPALVDLPTVVRNLAPVLKHVAGGHVEVRLPPRSSPLTVDLATEEVERVLVNLAAYGRERMPFGGRLTIEVGTSIVDRQFTAKYPNVRPGPHALITVSEARRAPQPDRLVQFRGGPSARNSRGTVDEKRGIELGTIQGLVGECGGHLWMKVEPLGDIVAKIRLPLLASDGQPHARVFAAGGGRARAITRWFQH